MTGEEGDALVDDGAGQAAVRGERDGDRVSMRDAIAWKGGRRLGGRKEGHGGRRQLVVVKIACVGHQHRTIFCGGR